MGNEASSFHVNPDCLRGEVVITKSLLHDVNLYNSTDKLLSKFRVLQLKLVDRSDDIEAHLKHHTYLSAILKTEITPDNLLLNALTPVTCRHPTVLQVYRGIPDPVHQSLFLVTEPCLPLSCLLPTCTNTDILLGSRSILQALDFVHSQLSMSHNNVRVSSIYIGLTRSQWKLGGFEFATHFSRMNSRIAELIERLHSEPADSESVAFTIEQPYAYDIYAFSRLVIRIISNLEDPKIFEDFLHVLRKSCMHSDPRIRLPPSQLLAHRVFKHPLVQAFDFFENYLSKTDAEKMDFFRSFESKIATTLPIDVVCQEILPKFLDSSVFLDPPSQHIIRQILNPFDDLSSSDSLRPARSFLAQSSFKQYLSPFVIGKFRVHERQTRITLLEHFLGYMHLFSRGELRDVFLPEICYGVFDHYEPLCALSLQALGHLSSLLGGLVCLNAVRQTECRLKRDGKFIQRNPNTHWPQTRLFCEAAPKISRIQREAPVCEFKSNGPVLSLAQMASLSATYEPNSNPLLMDAQDDNGGPSALKGNVIKLNSTTVSDPDPIDNVPIAVSPTGKRFSPSQRAGSVSTLDSSVMRPTSSVSGTSVEASNSINVNDWETTWDEDGWE